MRWWLHRQAVGNCPGSGTGAPAGLPEQRGAAGCTPRGRRSAPLASARDAGAAARHRRGRRDRRGLIRPRRRDPPHAGGRGIVVLERASAVGGTWRRSPGCACDIPLAPVLLLLRAPDPTGRAPRRNRRSPPTCGASWGIRRARAGCTVTGAAWRRSAARWPVERPLASSTPACSSRAPSRARRSPGRAGLGEVRRAPLAARGRLDALRASPASAWRSWAPARRRSGWCRRSPRGSPACTCCSGRQQLARLSRLAGRSSGPTTMHNPLITPNYTTDWAVTHTPPIRLAMRASFGIVVALRAGALGVAKAVAADWIADWAAERVRRLVRDCRLLFKPSTRCSLALRSPIRTWPISWSLTTAWRSAS